MSNFRAGNGGEYVLLPCVLFWLRKYRCPYNSEKNGRVVCAMFQKLLRFGIARNGSTYIRIPMRLADQPKLSETRISPLPLDNTPQAHPAAPEWKASSMETFVALAAAASAAVSM